MDGEAEFVPGIDLGERVAAIAKTTIELGDDDVVAWPEGLRDLPNGAENFFSRSPCP